MKMQTKKRRIQHLLSTIICFVMLSCLAVGSSYSVMAETTNEAVTRVNNSLMHAYEEAIHEKYRFFSFGDAMFIADLKGEK